jgi:hypothetical protein
MQDIIIQNSDCSAFYFFSSINRVWKCGRCRQECITTNKKNPMKKLLFILSVFVSVHSFGQISAPAGFTGVNANYEWLGGIFRDKFALPSDTFHVPTGLRNYAFVVRRNDSTWYWSTVIYTWLLDGGGISSVASIFGRVGNVTALSGDYSSFYPLITDVYSKTQSDARFAPVSHTHTSADITDFTTAVRNLFSSGSGISYNNVTGIIAATGLGGGGGADVFSVFGRTGTVTAQSTDYSSFYPLMSGSYANPSWITSLPWSKITSTPTTVSDYGITDAYTQTQINNFFSGGTSITGYNKTNWDAAFGWGNHASVGYKLNSDSSHTVPGAYVRQDRLINFYDSAKSNLATTTQVGLKKDISDSSHTVPAAYVRQDRLIDFGDSLANAIIVGTSSGETNTASNLGGGLANYDSKSGVDLRFNSFNASDFDLASHLISIDYTNTQKATTSQPGALSSTDWNTFNNKVSTSRTISTTSPLSGGGDLSSDRTLSISQANTSTNGYLSSTDWNTFNGKQAALTFGNLVGTSNQISLSGSGTNALANGTNITLSLPQDINTTSNVQFGTSLFGSLLNSPASNYVIAGRQSANNRPTLVLQRNTNTSPTGDFISLYDAGTTPAKLFNVDITGQITVGSYAGTSIPTTYTDAKIKTVTGTTNRLSISGTSTDPIFDISSSYVGQSSITTLGTITTGVWNGTAIGDTYISSAATWNGKQSALSGTGFVKIAGTTISYDNSTYVPTSTAINGKALSGSITLSLASADFANQGTTTTILHGNAAGNPSFGQIVNADITNSTIDVTTKITGIVPSGNLPSTIVYTGQSNTYTAGTKQTFSASALSVGLNIAGVAGDPSPLSNGDVWYNTSTNTLKYKINGTNRVVANLDESQAFTNKDLTGSGNTFPTFNQNTTGSSGSVANALTFSTGLTGTTGTYNGSVAVTVTNNLSTGVSGGQSIIGGTASGNNLTLSSTSNATKGKLLFGTSAYDEVNNSLLLGTTTNAASAILNLSSTSKGFLPPVMNYTQFTGISSPAEGLVAYDNIAHHAHYYNGTAWKTLLDSAAAATLYTYTPGPGIDITANVISNNSYNQYAKASVTTTDATVTTLATISFSGSLTTSNGILEVSLVGTQQTSGVGITGKKYVRFHVESGTVTFGTLVGVAADEVDAALSGSTWTIDQSSGAIRIRVTGLASNTIIWTAAYKVLQQQWFP